MNQIPNSCCIKYINSNRKSTDVDIALKNLQRFEIYSGLLLTSQMREDGSVLI